MKTTTLQRIFKIYDDLKNGGYEDFMNYEICKSLLLSPESNLTKVYNYIITKRPSMDMVNLVCTVNGALCYIAAREFALPTANSIFDLQHTFDDFIGKNFSAIQDVLLVKSNNPTIPQRAISVACHLPKGKNVGLLELGCSRGDIGLVLLNLEKILKQRQDYFFDNFNDAVSEKELKNAVGINRYLGIDINTAIDDEWLIALWGLKDFRRKKLSKFYSEFQPNNQHNFKRIEENACTSQKYLDIVIEYFSRQDTLVILTSFMVYQLTYEERKDLLEAIKILQDRFLQLNPYKNTIWIEQGIEASKLMTASGDFKNCYLSQFYFEKEKIIGRPLARLYNDACEGWKSLDNEVVILQI